MPDWPHVLGSDFMMTSLDTMKSLMSILPKVREQIYNLYSSKDPIYIADTIQTRNAFLFKNKSTIKFTTLKLLYLLLMICGLWVAILVKLFVR